MHRVAAHEDLYGNCAEAPPPVPETGQWHWPAAPPAAITMGDDAQQRTEHDALQARLRGESWGSRPTACSKWGKLAESAACKQIVTKAGC